MRPVVLASGSPRRRELLTQMGVAEFEILPARGEETAPDGLTPDALVRCLALQKAQEISALRPDSIVIGADTVVVLDDAVLGKPKDEADAVRMLSALQGRTHKVYTGLAVLCGTQVLQHAECTSVTFRAMTAAEITDYAASGEPMDKAGAYGIQGLACRFIRGIEGDYYNVVGLPVCALDELLQKLD